MKSKNKIILLLVIGILLVASITVFIITRNRVKAESSSLDSECPHDWEEETDEIIATCVTPGRTIGTKCTACGKQMTGGVSTGLNPNNHENIQAIPSQAPTCTSEGHTGGAICTSCGVTISSPTSIPKIDHIGATHANGGKCTVCGTVYQTHGQSSTVKEYTKTETGHIPIYGCIYEGCTETYTGTEENHTGATHANGGKCTVCDYVYQTHSQSSTVKEYTKTETGHTALYRCSVTGCTATYTGETEEHCGGTHENDGTCTVCGYKYQIHSASQEVKEYVDITEDAHTPIYACSCTDCKETYKGNPVPHVYNQENNTKCVCGAIKKCEHTYEVDKAGATASQHWEKCTKCGDKRNAANHTWNKTTGKCTVCEYECKHTNTTPKKDDTYHWDECDTCGKEINKEEHTYTDGECECGTKEPTCEHNYQVDKAGATATQHWEKCTKCGDKRNVANHTWNKTTGKCTVCEYECKHTHTTQKKDDKYHWDECDICEKEINKKEHTYTDGECECGVKDPDFCEHKNKEWGTNQTEHWEKCKDCGKEIPETREKHLFENGKCKKCETEDSTASGKLPNTGMGTITILIVGSLALLATGVIGVRKYKDI